MRRRAPACRIVTRVVDDEDVAGEAHALARRLADGPARAFGRARRLVRNSFGTPLSEQLDREARTIATSVAEPESAALITRFLSRGR